MRSLLIVTTHQKYWSEEIKNNEIGGHCSILAYGRAAFIILLGKPERHRPLGNPGVDGKIILERNLQEML